MPATTSTSAAGDGIAERRSSSRSGSSSEVARGAELAAEDEALGVEQVAQRSPPRRRWFDPASAMTRWQAGSPSRASASGCGRVTGPSARLELAEQCRPPTSVSRQPRLPQRQTGPARSKIVWPISPAVPPRPAQRTAVGDQPGADARRDLQVDDVGAALCRAERPLAERAEVGVVVDENREADALGHRILRADADPDRAGSWPSRAPPTAGGSVPAGPCRPRRRLLRSTPASASTWSKRRAAASDACARPCGRASSSTRCSARIVRPRSATATRRCRLPKSMPTAAPAETARRIRPAGRPAPRPPAGSPTSSAQACLDELRDDGRDRRPRERGLLADLGARERAEALHRAQHALAARGAARVQASGWTRSAIRGSRLANLSRTCPNSGRSNPRSVECLSFVWSGTLRARRFGDEEAL